MSGPRSWQTPEITEALARLEQAEVALDQAVLAAKQVEQKVPRTPLSEEDIRKVEEYARDSEAPRELRELQRRIDEGELSWQDIAAGRHLDDPKVQAALSTGVQGMQQAYTLIQEGQDLRDIAEAGPPARLMLDDEPDDEDRPDYHDDDPDDLGFRTVFRPSF